MMERPGFPPEKFVSFDRAWKLPNTPTHDILGRRLLNNSGSAVVSKNKNI
uniref:Uncharacterized protein n=1 Tax=Anguilla anguilla TaxID=7936 RepID=A0A0E9TZJ1_ANGAN